MHNDEYVRMLHEKKISSFLVTNAQFPDRIEQMDPVTQLYVSIDASTQESLKKIDRPLFKNFYERFLESLMALKYKKQRTVYRLTLVKDYNMNDIADYARLVALGEPSFIEVKGVTFCGKSDGSDLRMTNVPFHMEVKRFCEKLCSYLINDYELACEHEHSCCCLIAKKEFKHNGKWHTWINYEKFHELVQSGKEFTAYDYMEETPDWAVWGAKEQGFNPNELKTKKKNKKVNVKVSQMMQSMEQEIEKDKQLNLDYIDPSQNVYLLEKEKLNKLETQQEDEEGMSDLEENIEGGCG